MPRPVEALPCGSRSRSSTRRPILASAAPRLIAVVVLPTPPFWLAMAMIRGNSVSDTREPLNDQDPGLDICQALMDGKLKLPVAPRFGKFFRPVPALGEDSDSVRREVAFRMREQRRQRR